MAKRDENICLKFFFRKKLINCAVAGMTDKQTANQKTQKRRHYVVHPKNIRIFGKICSIYRWFRRRLMNFTSALKVKTLKKLMSYFLKLGWIGHLALKSKNK